MNPPGLSLQGCMNYDGSWNGKYGRKNFSSASMEITLPKTYSNTNFNVQATIYRERYSDYGVGTQNTAANKFKVHGGSTNLGAFRWLTHGVLASNQY